jgi:MFS family permease
MSENAIQQHNFRHLYHDVFWWGVLAGSTLSFLPIFLARLDASAFQVGLLTAGPAVVSLLFSLPAGRWLRDAEIVRSTFITAVLHRVAFLLILPLPWLLSGNALILTILVIVLLSAVAGAFISVSFNAMFADLVPSAERTAVVGRRNALLALSTTLTTLICGALLEVILFPLNYQVVFAIGIIGAGISAYHLARLQPVTVVAVQEGQPLRDFARLGRLFSGEGMRQGPGLRYLIRAGTTRLLRPEILKTAFGPFLLAYFVFYFIQHITVPLFPVYFVQDLALSDGVISIGSAVFNGAMLLASMQLGRLSRRGSPHNLLTISAVFYFVYPLMLSLAHGPNMFIAGSLLGGTIWAIANAGLVSTLMDRVPADDRPAHMALHNVTLNLAILLGSFSGPIIADYVGLRGAILIGAGLRIVAGLVIGWIGRPSDSEPGMLQSPAP